MKSYEKIEKISDNYLKEPYTRILITTDGKMFSAEILEFPGCFAVGATPDEALRNIEGAAKSWIEAALAQGQKIPLPAPKFPHKRNREEG